MLKLGLVFKETEIRNSEPETVLSRALLTSDNMKSKYYTLSISVLVVIILGELSDAALPFGIFPILTTGWYYKPGPVESIVLGLIVVKLLAIRLGATLAGVPYHLNDIFDSKHGNSWNLRGRRHLFEDGNGNSTVPLSVLSPSEMKVIERILLALKRIDSHDCFIRYICQLQQKSNNGQAISPGDDDTWLKIFSLRPIKSTTSESKTTVWDIYEKALSPSTNCSREYSSCPLTVTDLGAESILSGIF